MSIGYLDSTLDATSLERSHVAIYLKVVRSSLLPLLIVSGGFFVDRCSSPLLSILSRLCITTM